MLVALAVNAATVNITPGTATLQTAVAAAAAGDVIVLADGVYNESGDYIVLNKNLEIKAAEDAHPVVNVMTYVKIQEGAKVRIEGIKFDGTQQGSYSHFFRVTDNAANSLELEGCELCHNNNIFIKVEAANHIDSIKINNCYFHHGNSNAIRCYKASAAPNTCGKLVITNSTFANFGVPDYGFIEVENVGNTVTNDIVLRVDHCTFYNITKPSDNTYGVIDARKSTDNVISNCIFTNPANLPSGRFAHKATQLYGGTVSNCLVYNTPNHRTDAITLVDPLFDVDPLMVDTAAGDFTLGEGSPALTAAADSSAIGDPRWLPSQGLPYMAIIGEWNGWVGNELVPDSAEVSASCTVSLTMNQNSGYGFKVLVGSVAYCIQPGQSWYAFHRDWTTASGIDYAASESEAFWLQIDMAGDYGFKWTMAEKKLEITFPEMPTRTVYFVNNMGWDSVYAYAWDPQIAAWPGEIMELTNLEYTYPIYSYTLPVNRQNIIFNDGTGGEGHQTADLTINENALYYFNGQWYASVADLPTNLKVVNNDVKAVKVIKNGQILIQKANKTFTVLGTEVTK